MQRIAMHTIYRLVLLFCLWDSPLLVCMQDVIDWDYKTNLEYRFKSEVQDKPAAQVTDYFDEFIRNELNNLMQTDNLGMLLQTNQDFHHSLKKYKTFLALVDNNKQTYSYEEKINIRNLRKMMHQIDASSAS